MTKIYELVKYRYGWAHYTAFCLTPKLDKPTQAIVHGVVMRSTSEGPGSQRANHFQNPESAKAWAEKNGATIHKPDWSLLPGSGIWPPV